MFRLHVQAACPGCMFRLHVQAACPGRMFMLHAQVALNAIEPEKFLIVFALRWLATCATLHGSTPEAKLYMSPRACLHACQDSLALISWQQVVCQTKQGSMSHRPCLHACQGGLALMLPATTPWCSNAHSSNVLILLFMHW